MLDNLSKFSTGSQLDEASQTALAAMAAGAGSNTVAVSTKDNAFVNTSPQTPNTALNLSRGQQVEDRHIITVDSGGVATTRDYALYENNVTLIQRNGWIPNPANSVYSLAAGAENRMPRIKENLVRGTYFYKAMKITCVASDTGLPKPIPIATIRHFRANTQQSLTESPIYITDGEQSSDQRIGFVILPLFGMDTRADVNMDFIIDQLPPNYRMTFELITVLFTQAM